MVLRWYRCHWRAAPIGALGVGERALLRAAAEALFPSDGPISVSGVEAGAVPYFSRMLNRSQQRQQYLFRLLLVFTELSPLLFGPRWARFSRLSDEQRRQCFHAAANSRLYFRRIAALSLRALLTFAYFADERVARQLPIRSQLDPFGCAAEPAFEEAAQVPAPAASHERLKPSLDPGVEQEEVSEAC